MLQLQFLEATAGFREEMLRVPNGSDCQGFITHEAKQEQQL